MLFLVISLFLVNILFFISPVINSTFQGENKYFTKGGEFIINGDTGIIKIYIPQNDSRYESVLKHELCHKEQWEQGRIYESKLGRFINELECSIKQYV